MNDIRQKLLAAFQAEHREHLEQIRGILGKRAEGGPLGADLDEVFRRAHSLKGAARAVDLRPVETLAHRLETLFSRVREGALRLDGETVRLVQGVLDEIEDLTATLLGGQAPAGPSLTQAAIERLLGLEAEAAPAVQIEAPAPALPLGETVRVSAASLDRLHRSTGQLLAESRRQEAVTQGLHGIARLLAGMDREWQRLHQSAAAPPGEANPELLRLAGRLQFVERQGRDLAGQVRAVHRLQQQSAYALRHLGQQLQDDIRQARTVPAGSVFEGFGKMVRDLGRDEGKQVEFQVSGFEVQADRVVLQALKDPLMHLLRNAISHGIEPAGERERAGKAPAGQVRLRIEVQGKRLGIWVEDDGRGIDLRGVAGVAVQKGLLAATAAAASPQELLRLIFQPGISTVQRATDLSGRGMGLSVVHEAVARLQGEVAVRQTEGQGTSMALWVPLSVAAHPLLLVACQGQVFGIPTHGIARLCRVRVQEVQSVEGRPAITLDKQPLPLLPLAQLLRLEDTSAHTTGDILLVVVLKSQEQRAVVVVDALLSVQEGLIQELRTPGRRLSHLAGGLLLEDGSVCLVLNPAALIEAFAEAKEVPIPQATAPAPAPRPPTILVVDDSVTTRTLERSILEAHGYRVRVAVDGVEALEQLRAAPVDLVVADIQMPRMDGFGLMEEMKKDERLKQIPVILVTSMTSEEDRRRGLELGAGAYIVKQKFDQRALLETIVQML
ncbi:MAG: response regulator [Candidatus Latescibacteria bacterium]|nr:response regulator [Candidatus Latescibacterota bacterium]